LKHIKKVHTSM